MFLYKKRREKASGDTQNKILFMFTVKYYVKVVAGTQYLCLHPFH